MVSFTPHAPVQDSFFSRFPKNPTPDERVVTLFLTQTHLVLENFATDWLTSSKANRLKIEKKITVFLPLCWQLALFLGLEKTDFF